MLTSQTVWEGIANTLRSEIAQEQYRAGDKLPSEAALALRFGVNRHTVRRALREIAAQGLVFARRGAGVFVAGVARADYALGQRVRYQQNIIASGRTPARKILRIETRAASVTEAEVLEARMAHVFEGISLADNLPMGLFCSIFPADRLPDLAEALGLFGSVTVALASVGVADYTRASTRITAQTATPLQAQLLKLPQGAPLLHSEAINRDPEGRVVEFGQTWFAGERVALTVAAQA